MSNQQEVQLLKTQLSRRKILAVATAAMMPLLKRRSNMAVAGPAVSDVSSPTLENNGVNEPEKPVRFFYDRGMAILENGFIHIEFDTVRAAITVLKADFYGKGIYQNNLLGRDGIRLEGVTADGRIIVPQIKTGATVAVAKKVEASGVEVKLPPIVIAFDAGDTASVTSQWTISLQSSARWFDLQLRADSSGSMLPGMVRLRCGCNQWFFNALYERGNVQRVEGLSEMFCSQNKLHVLYTMDCENGSISIVPQYPGAVLENNIFSGSVSQWGSSECGLDQVLWGASNVLDKWVPITNIDVQKARNPGGQSIVTSLRVYASDQAFPVHTLVPETSMDFDDLAAFYAAAYGSSAGVLGTYAIPGSAYPNLATPTRPYGDGNSFFDPDAWETVATLSFSGDPLLAGRARQVVERSGKNMTSEGQIPHNFNGTKPTKIALSGATQSGPNVFWSMACMDYALGTGDEAWLRTYYPTIKKAVEWLLQRYDPKVKLVQFTGSLFIDVFIRYGYTLDTNMATVGLLAQMAPVAEFCGDRAGAQRFKRLEKAIAEGIRKHLWNGTDHFVTQRNTDGTVRDFVDYDGNFGALAFGVVEDAQWRANMFYRLDRGPHTHPGGRGTWVSEKYYGTKDCYKGNTGDSATAMGRIWWLDMKARHRYPNAANLEMFNRTYENIRSDLLANIWLTERYNARGQRIRSPYYHEYPEIVCMVMRTMRYGINLRIDGVVIHPIEPRDFDFQFGQLRVTYRRERIIVRIPGRRKLRYEIFHLMPHATYRISAGASAKSDAHGRLEFDGYAGVLYDIRKIV